MKRLLIALAPLLVLLQRAVPVGAQAVIYTPYEKFDIRNGDFAVVGKCGGRLYTYRSGSEGAYLDSWDDSLNRIATIVLDFFPDKISNTKFIAYPDKMIVLYQAQERGTVNQYAARLDAEARLLGTPVLLASERSSFFGSNRHTFSSAVSDDRRRIVTYTVDDRGNALQLDAKVLDDSLRVIARLKPKYEAGQDLTAGDLLVANDGTLLLPAFAQTGGRNYAAGIKLLSLAPESTSFKTVELPMQGQYASGVYLRFDQSNRYAYAAGFYSGRRAGNFDGVLFAQYDLAGGSFVTQRLMPLGDSVRDNTGIPNSRRALNNFEVRNLVVRNDGGFVLLAESYYLSIRGTASPYYGYYSFYSPMSMATNVREYHYDDIMALSYSPAGSLEWNSFVRKEQYSQEDGGVFSSYAFFNTGGALGFLYNDFNTSHSTIQLATIDPDGNVGTRSMAAGSSDDPDWIPRSGKQVAARELVIPCMHKRQITFAKVMF